MVFLIEDDNYESEKKCCKNNIYYVAGNEYDAGAIEFITNKGAKIQVSAKMFDKVEPINPLETRIMNLVYRLKYSKQAGK